MDDGLGCADNVRDAVKILTTAKSTLDKFNIRLHKICSTRTEVLNSFPESEVENFPANKDFNFWRIKFLADNFWKLWYKHYTNNLQCRQKMD